MISAFTFSKHARFILGLTERSISKGPSVRMVSLLNKYNIKCSNSFNYKL
jgi:hypothetical protein